MTAKTCGFGLAWIGKCPAVPTPGSTRCDKHKDLKCCSCQKPASRECEHTGIQFVCGAHLCNDCQHGWIMPNADPGLFNLGGGHVDKKTYEEQTKEYYRLEAMMLCWRTAAGEDCFAESKFGNYYVLINHDTQKFVASLSRKNLFGREIDTKKEAMKLCQQHYITLCEEKAKAGG